MVIPCAWVVRSLAARTARKIREAAGMWRRCEAADPKPTIYDPKPKSWWGASFPGPGQIR